MNEPTIKLNTLMISTPNNEDVKIRANAISILLIFSYINSPKLRIVIVADLFQMIVIYAQFYEKNLGLSTLFFYKLGTYE